ncbi:MAG: galactose oxidase-like domain-containing protein [Methanobacteriota archaeon]
MTRLGLRAGIVGSLALTALILSPAAAILDPPPASEAGAWEEPFDGQVPAINMVLLPEGRVAYWSGLDAAETGVTFFVHSHIGKGLSRVLSFNETGVPAITTPLPEDGGGDDLFCSGNSVLPDGRVVVAGGTYDYRNSSETNGPPSVRGSPDTRILAANGSAWTTADEMAYGRWYPSVVTLSDGTPLVAAGVSDLADSGSHVTKLETYNATSDTWTGLPASTDRLLPMYPRLHVVPSGPHAGKVVYTAVACLWCPFGEASDESLWGNTQILDVGAASWTDLGSALFGARQAGSSVPLRLEPPSYTAEYATFGGTLGRSLVATPTGEITDLSVVPPARMPLRPMTEGRWHPNSVLLPTGDILVVGGGRHDDVLAPGHPEPVLSAELLDPDFVDATTGVRGRWTTLSSMEVPRVYHSTAVLLPDARVLVGGHVSFPNPFTHDHVEEQVFETRFEIFDPPYLFRGARPAITTAPASVAYGASFVANVTGAGASPEFVLVRPGATTHAYDSEQRAIVLAATEVASGSYSLTAPANANLAPPGWYLLFAVKAPATAGEVPSVAHWVRVG